MDIDIDFQTTFDPTNFFHVVRASIITDNQIKPHPCGYYFQNIPIDPVSGLSAIPYKEANSMGYTKIDFLHLAILDIFDNKQQIRVLLKKEPKWGLLLREDVVSKLFQLHENVTLVRRVKPTSILEIADCISLIRPGKMQLIDDYLIDRVKTRHELYTKRKDDKYAYKKGHAISYAMIVVLQLHLIDAGIL